ncbi:MAG: dephospho-CoA kinase [Psychromonas sp.]|nr:dephospho-CoA kinase [Psychromonas sp.]
MTLIIGLTGGIGCGKSTVSALFEKRGVDIIDADKVARLVVEKGNPALLKIADHFGAEVLIDGCLNRPRLRQIIFSDNKQKVWLNKLLHPLIRTEMLAQLKNSKSDYVLLEAPLLIENKLTDFCDHVLVVDVSEKLQLSRACHRDGMDVDSIKSIIQSQMTRQARLQNADFVIENSDATFDQLARLVMELDNKFRKLCKLQ